MTPIPVDLVVQGPRVITDGVEQPAAVAVSDGRIIAVEPLGTAAAAAAAAAATQVVELTAWQVLIPGLVDTHVHVNEPGRTEWEGFDTATRAAAAGGVTTLVDMPLNSVPSTVDVAALEVKRDAARDRVHIDVAFWGGAVPSSLGHLRALHDAGVVGFKCFLLHSGVDEFPALDMDQLEQACAEVAAFDGLLIVHAEDAAAIENAPPPRGRDYGAFLASRPRGAENLAIAGLIERARWTGARVHVVHLSSSDALAMIDSARADGVRITAETCPHYLTLSAEEVPAGATQYKCCPPIREGANRDLLWGGLRRGTIGLVVSDHSPCTADLKLLDEGDFGRAWGGVASVQLGLPAVWTEARNRGIALTDVVRWMAEAPAALVGLRHKGFLRVGGDADLVVFAPDRTFVVDPAALHHRNPVTPYAGKELAGVVERIWLRGREVDGVAPHGTLLRAERD